MKEHPSVKAHQRAVDWARAKALAPDTLVADSETCGKEHDAGLVDLAIITMSGQVLFDSFINPGHAIPEDASRVHGIHDSDVAFAPFWKDVYQTVAAFLDGRTVLAYNSPFDSGVIAAECRMAGLPFIQVNWEDALKAFSEFEGAPGKYPGSYRYFKLSEAAAKFGITPGTHRALADAIACKDVVLAMARSGEPARASPADPVQRPMFDLPDASRFTR